MILPRTLELAAAICDRYARSQQVKERARELVMSFPFRQGKSPRSVAAAAVYLAAFLCDERLTQKDVAKAARVTEATVRNLSTAMRRRVNPALTDGFHETCGDET